MSSSALHEAEEHLSRETRAMHRAPVSLIEEFEAVDGSGQRLDATGDDELRAVLDPNQREEKVHACPAERRTVREPGTADYGLPVRAAS